MKVSLPLAPSFSARPYPHVKLRLSVGSGACSDHTSTVSGTATLRSPVLADDEVVLKTYLSVGFSFVVSVSAFAKSNTGSVDRIIGLTQTEKDYILWLVVTKEMHEYFYAGAKGIVL